MYAIEVIRHLEREARETARLARAAKVDAENALALVTCVGCSHPNHVALRCDEQPKFSYEKGCGCDLHFGLWPDEKGYPPYIQADGKCRECDRPIYETEASATGYAHTNGGDVFRHPNTDQRPVRP